MPFDGDALIQLVIPGTPLAVRGALSGLFQGTSLRRLPPPLRETAELVLAEVLNNIVARFPDPPAARPSCLATGCARPRTPWLAAGVAIDMICTGGRQRGRCGDCGAVLLGICEPQMTGIGGDCFVLVKAGRRGAGVALNGSGRAPGRAVGGDARAGWPPCRLRARGGDRARRGRRLLPPVRRLGRLGWPGAGPRDPLRRGEACPSPRAWRDWARRPMLQGGRAHALSSERGGRPPWAQLFRAPGQAEVLRRIAATGPRRLLRRRGGRGHGGQPARAGRHPYAGRFRRHRLHLGRTRSAAPTRGSTWWSIRRTGRGRPPS
jgi:hypothetical protein